MSCRSVETALSFHAFKCRLIVANDASEDSPYNKFKRVIKVAVLRKKIIGSESGLK
jgi:hypothetical protein